MPEIFLGRQPIFDQRLNVVGYELLYRDFEVEKANITNDDQATTQVILFTFSESGFKSIVGSHLAFINLTPSFLFDRLPIPFSPAQIVLEVPETIVVTPSVQTALQRLIQRGYQIALDDVIQPNDVRALLPLAHIIKVDLRGVPSYKLAEQVADLRRYNVKLLAEKVETQEEFTLCRNLGFELFQGYFLCRPKIMRRRQVPPSRLAVLRMMSILQDPECDLKDLEAVVALDATLSYKILQLVNSAHFGLMSRIQSLRQAITLIGFEQLRGWLTLILMSYSTNKPRELMTIGMTRARMCEGLARAANAPFPSSFFLVGLLSVLEAMMDLPMEAILEQVPLTSEIVLALTQQKGELGEALQAVLNYEQANWNEVQFYNLTRDQIRTAYVQAIDWAERIQASVLQASA